MNDCKHEECELIKKEILEWPALSYSYKCKKCGRIIKETWETIDNGITWQPKDVQEEENKDEMEDNPSQE